MYKFASKCHSQTTPSLERIAPPVDNQTRNYDIGGLSYLHPYLSTLRSKGLSRSKMNW